MWATLSFVPTPSVEATSTWPRPGERKSPPKLPISLSTPGVRVPETAFLMDLRPRSISSMSTPAAA